MSSGPINFEHTDRDGDILNEGEISAGELYLYVPLSVSSLSEWLEFREIIDAAYRMENHEGR